jgi:hypothetical protein
MSAEITRGPCVCPSCGEANPPATAYCRLCATALGEASFELPHQVPVPFHFPPPDTEQVLQPPTNKFNPVAVLFGIMLLLFVAFGVTLVTVSSTTTSLSPDYIEGLCLGIFLGFTAATFVVIGIQWAFSRFKVH